MADIHHMQCPGQLVEKEKNVDPRLFSIVWCRGRDLNPGHGLERPAYLSGLYYRGAVSTFVDSNLKVYFLV